MLQRISAGRRRLIVFVVTAYALAWLAALPLHLAPGLRQGVLFTVFASLMMVTPALALVIAHRLVPAGYRLRDLLGLKPGPWRRWLPPALIGWVGFPLAVVAALGLAALTGLYHPDLRGLSGYRESLATAGAAEPGMPVAVLVVITLAIAPLAAIVPNGLFAAGEEFGWRGYLQPEVGMVATGVIWGLWHTPLLLLGYNFPGLPAPLRLLFMVVGCILLSGILGILHQAARTVWVPAVAHGALNAWASSGALFVDSAHPYRFELAGILGVCGWVVLAVFYLILRRTITVAPSVPLGTTAPS